MTRTLQAMRDLNRADPLGELGPRVEPPPAPAPAPFSRGDGFLVHPDGKLSTEIPPPPGPATPPVRPFPTALAEPPAEPAGDVPALKVGDKVRVLNPRPWNLTAKDVSGPWTLLYPAKNSFKPDHYKTDSGWFFWTGPSIVEGRDWERVA